MTRSKLDNLTDAATEAEVDLHRHEMEEAILATLANDPFDQNTIAHALIESITEGIVPDEIVIVDKLLAADIR